MTDRLPRGGSLLAAPLIALALALAAPSALLAQQGAVSGQVTDASTGQPVSGAQVFVVDGQAGTLTGEDGNYRLTGVPTGDQQIRVQVIGFQNQTRSVQVQSGQATTANFQLDVSAVSLQDVVVTATGERQQRELGNAMSSIDAGETVENTNPTDFTDLLSGNATGVTIQTGSGSVGTASTIKIRGNSSLGLSTTPIVYVDGARINNNNEVGANVGGQNISRLNDLDPTNIESVDIIKGPAAATLYGTEASTGVIRITTKSGVEREPRFTLRTDQGLQWDDTHWWSMAWNPTRGVVNIGGAADTTYVQSLMEGTRYGRPFRTGHTQSYSGNVTGGGGGISYFVSGRVEDIEGNLPTNKVDNWQGRANANLAPTPELDIQFSTQFNSTFRELPENDNNLYGIVGNALGSPWYGPMTRNGTNTCFLAYEAARVSGGDLGAISDATCSESAPYFVSTFDKIFERFNQEQLERFIGSTSITWRPIEQLRNNVNIGYDHAQSSLRAIVPVDPTLPFGSQSEGLVQQTDRMEKNITLEANSQLTLPVTDQLSSQTTLGFQWFDDLTEVSFIEGRNFPAGSPSVGNSVENEGDDSYAETKTMGFFLQEQLSYADKLYFTPGIRLDDNSAFGANLGLEEYIQANASYVLSEEEWFPAAFDQFKVRAAWGESGKQPGSNDALALLATIPVRTNGQDVLGVSAAQPPNDSLKPETGEEWEVGFDASLLNDRLGLNFTYYDQVTNNAIVQRPLAPSTGFPDERFVNVAEITNTGIEATLNATPVRREDFTWNANFNLSTNSSDITRLPEPIILGAQRHKKGFPFGSYFARSVEYRDGSVVVSDTAEFQGRPTPKWEGSLGTTFNFFDHITLYAQGSYAGGHSMLNGTEDFNCGLFGGGGYFGSCTAMYKLTEDGQRTPEAQVKARASAIGSEAPFVYDADFLKLRRATLRFTLPESWIAGIGLRRASLGITARNLAMWTSYEGLDPEMNVSGSDQVIRQQFIGLPPSRSITTNIEVTF